MQSPTQKHLLIPKEYIALKVGAKQNRSRHGKPTQKLFAMVNQTAADSKIGLVSQAFKDLVLG
jgi:hypothetical protein